MMMMMMIRSSVNYRQGRRNEYESGGARIHPAQSAGKNFLSCPPLFIQCPPKWRGTAQCNVLSLQPSTVHRPRGYKVCKLSHCDELIYVIMEVDYKLCKAQRQTTRHHWTLNFTCHLFTIFPGKNEIKLLKFVTSFNNLIWLYYFHARLLTQMFTRSFQTRWIDCQTRI